MCGYFSSFMSEHQPVVALLGMGCGGDPIQQGFLWLIKTLANEGKILVDNIDGVIHYKIA